MTTWKAARAALALLAAVNVIRRTPALRAWLTVHDPKALEQLDRAAALAGDDAIVTHDNQE